MIASTCPARDTNKLTPRSIGHVYYVLPANAPAARGSFGRGQVVQLAAAGALMTAV